jgi:acetyl-CoA acyltransferase
MIPPASARDAVIVEAVRTPVGRRGGALAGIHPADLGGAAIAALFDRSGLDPAQVDDVVFGCVLQVGEQGLNIGRSAVLAAGLPEEVPAVTVDRQCGSGQQALHFAAQAVMSGVHDVVVAAGVESMSRVPMFSNVTDGPGLPYGDAFRERYGVTEDVVHQGNSAESIAATWDVSRAQMDELALRSHQRAAAARDAGAFEAEIVPVEVDGTTVTTDEGIRPDTSLEKLAGLRTVFSEDGVVTAGNSSQISDGASALLVVAREVAERQGLRPRARIVGQALAAADPILMLTAPIPATQRVLDRTGLGVDDIDTFEVNEAFACVPLAWMAEMGVGPERVNPDGGAIALGHPLGGSGGRIATTMLHHLERTGGRFGLQTMCEGGGTANATILERLD